MDEKLDFHADDVFESEMVAINIDTLTSTPIDQLTAPELARLIIVPKVLEGAILRHIKDAKTRDAKSFDPETLPSRPAGFTVTHL